MPTLHKHLHVIAFVILLILIAVLNAGPFAVGWPFPFPHLGARGAPWPYRAFANCLINALPCMMILSLCMVPFAYDSKRSFSLGAIIQFTTASCLGFLILTPSYLKNYQAGDHLLIIVLTALAMNGLLSWPIRIVANYVELPQWRKPERAKDGDPLDFD